MFLACLSTFLWTDNDGQSILFVSPGTTAAPTTTESTMTKTTAILSIEQTIENLRAIVRIATDAEMVEKAMIHARRSQNAHRSDYFANKSRFDRAFDKAHQKWSDLY